VVIQNLAPGSAHRIGIAAAVIAARFPRAVAVDVSGYGVGGRRRGRRALLTDGVLAAPHAPERTRVGAAISISTFDVIAEFVGFALRFTRHTGE